MKKFLYKLSLYFLSIFLVLLILFFLPPTPRSKTSFLFAKLAKDDLFEKTPAPRIILIGGSNLAFGINSQMLKDSLKLNPINTSVSFGNGILYMLAASRRFIKQGDIVVIAPEYFQFGEEIPYGMEELLRTVTDVTGFKDLTLLSFRQVIHLAPYLPNYLGSKVNHKEYHGFGYDTVYGRWSYNRYGDDTAYYHMPNQIVKPYDGLDEEINQDVIRELKSYESFLSKFNAKLILTFPCFQSSSFNNSKGQIQSIERTLRQNGFVVAGTAERYKMNDSIIFNTPYHLSKKGVDYRTSLLIADLKNVLH